MQLIVMMPEADFALAVEVTDAHTQNAASL